MSTAAVPVTKPPAPPTKQSLLHNFLVDLKNDVVAFPMLITALQAGSALPGAFASLETFRTDLVGAYSVFQKVETLLAQLKALAPTA